MPNHVRATLIFKGNAEDIKSLRERVETPNNYFDFNAIVPMPEELRDRVPKYVDEQTAELRAKYGYDNWYDWAYANWGTKWNQYGEQWRDESDRWVGENEVNIVTAWCFPRGVLITLSQIFPNITISYVYADEDAGYNVGRGEIRNGEIEIEEIKPATRLAFDIFFELHPECEDDYKLVDNGDGTCRLEEKEESEEEEEEEEEEPVMIFTPTARVGNTEHVPSELRPDDGRNLVFSSQVEAERWMTAHGYTMGKYGSWREKTDEDTVIDGFGNPQ